MYTCTLNSNKTSLFYKKWISVSLNNVGYICRNLLLETQILEIKFYNLQNLQAPIINVTLHVHKCMKCTLDLCSIKTL